MRTLLLFSLIASVTCFGDYAWIPRSHHLALRFGGEYFKSSENFISSSARDDIIYNGQPAELSKFGFFVVPEYGLTDGLAASLKIPFQMVSLNLPTASGINSLSSNGLGDLDASLKYSFHKRAPLLTAELNFKVPTESYYIEKADQLLREDGCFELGGTLHIAHQFGVGFFDVSPGIVIRFNGYASGFLGRSMIGAKFQPGYFFAFTNFYTSFGNNLLFDSSANVHDAGGAGGSYAILSGSPSSWDVGLRAALRIAGTYFAEASFSQTIWGRRAPNFFTIGLSLLTDIDFSTPDTRVRTREIPFDAPKDTPYSTEPAPKEKKESKESRGEKTKSED